jgi:hypothetical protein
MKVHYGGSIPPGLTAPTRGELLIRVERLILQDELLAPLTPAGAPLIPVDHCAIQFAFWGMGSASSSSSSGGQLATCVPATDAHADRGVQRVVFPVKTLEPQLIQYFQHMHNSSNRGVQLRVTVPPQFSGKKSHIPVGIAIVNVSGVTSSTPIQGWFHVMHHEDESQCIGRVKVSISLTMFAPTTLDDGKAGESKRKDTPHTYPADQHDSGATSSVAQLDAVDETAAPPEGRSKSWDRAEGSTTKHDDVSSSSRRAESSFPADRHVSFAGHNAHALADVTQRDNIAHPAAHPSSIISNNGDVHRSTPTTTTTTTTQQHANPSAALFSEVDGSPQNTSRQHATMVSTGSSGDAQLRSWFERGVALRNRMTQACSSTSSTDINNMHHNKIVSRGGSLLFHSGIAQSSSSSAAFLSTSLDAALPPFRPTSQISGAEHLLRRHQGGAADLNDSSSSTTTSSDEDDVSVSSDSDGAATSPLHHHHHRRDLDVGRGGNITIAATGSTNSITCDCTLELSLRNIGFASGPMPRPEVPQEYLSSSAALLQQQLHSCELRFSLRWSRDVVLADPTLLTASLNDHAAIERDASSSSVAALSSFVHILPFPPGHEDRAITLQLPRVLSYTTQSKLVVECIHVLSIEAPAREQHPVISSGAGELSFDVHRMHHEHLQAQLEQDRSSVRRVVIAEVVVGVCVLDLCARSVKRCSFHNPLTGGNHVWADCSLELRPTHGDDTNAAAAELLTTTGPGEAIAFAADSYLFKTAKNDSDNVTNQKKRRNDNTRGLKTSEQRRTEDVPDGSSDSLDDEDGGSSASSCTGTTDDSIEHIASRRRSRHRHQSERTFDHRDRSSSAPRVVVYTDDAAHRETSTTTTETTVTIRHQQRAPDQRVSLPLLSSVNNNLVPPTTTTNTTTRFHLSILEAKGLPLVCAQDHRHQLDTSEDASYRAPRTFVNLENILELRKSKLLASTAANNVLPGNNVDMLCCTHPQALGIREEWFVEAAVQGDGTRSNPQMEGSTAPRFAFECIVAIVAAAAETPLPLCEIAGSLEVGLYHVSDDFDVNTHQHCQESDDAARERRLWRASRPMGRVIVDLSPLRYLPHTDGWHRVISVGDVLDTVIGFVRVGVRTL